MRKPTLTLHGRAPSVAPAQVANDQGLSGTANSRWISGVDIGLRCDVGHAWAIWGLCLTIFGAAIGALIGGAPGAVIGAVVGYWYWANRTNSTGVCMTTTVHLRWPNAFGQRRWSQSGRPDPVQGGCRERGAGPRFGTPRQ
jgi:hypothetical protein